MRILQVSSARYGGGGETHVRELAEGLRSRGHQVGIAGHPQGPLHPDFSFASRNAADFLAALRLRRLLQREEVEIAHAHNARDYAVLIAASWRLPQVKVVFTRHLLYPVRRHPFYRRVDGWIAPTRQILAALDPLQPRHSAVIPNWVDLAKFAFRPHGARKPVTVGLLGQISPHKGHDDAIAALRLLGPEYHMAMAGRGEEVYVQALRQQAAGLAVEFWGEVSAPEFLNQVDILLVPSWEEPFGLVLLEAMAAGIPLIATNRGGPREIVRAGVDGLLIEPRRPPELAAAIATLAGNPSLRESLAASARKRVEREFDKSAQVARIEAFYTLVRGEGAEVR